MEFIHTQKFVRMAPSKIRPVVDMVRHLSPMQAIETLPLIRKRASLYLTKVIATAIANAKQKGVGESELKFKQIQIGEGPRLKRGRPVSRGRWHPYQKRMSHIRVVLETKELKKERTEELKEEENKTKNSNQFKFKSKKKGEKVST